MWADTRTPRRTHTHHLPLLPAALDNADEVIRQTAINSGERGLLLLRVRDEVRMVMASYQTLYESSIAFGLRKALLAEQRRNELQAKVRARQLEPSPGRALRASK